MKQNGRYLLLVSYMFYITLSDPLQFISLLTFEVNYRLSAAKIFQTYLYRLYIFAII